MKKNIAVIFGGRSPEYFVSLQSAYSVITNIDHDKYNVIPLGVTLEGDWFRYSGNYSNIPDGSWPADAVSNVPVAIMGGTYPRIIELYEGGPRFTVIDAAFPVMHGKNGEDGTVQGLFEQAGIPLIGCSTLSSALCMDKARAHALARDAGINVPKFITASIEISQEEIAVKAEGLKYPLYVKPVKAGSSFGISKISDPSQLSEAVSKAFEFDNEITIEEEIPGCEVGCAVLGKNKLIAGRVDQIETPGLFDYTEKYNPQKSKIHMPAPIDEELEKRIRQTALALYRLLGCSGFARVDMFLTPENKIVFNEINTIPGLTAHSRFPNMMKGAGMELKEVIQFLIELSLKDE